MMNKPLGRQVSVIKSYLRNTKHIKLTQEKEHGTAMTPTPQEPVVTSEKIPTTEQLEDLTQDGNIIVISGISGMYPQSRNVKELSDILYNKKNPITSEGLRWNYKHPDLPPFAGMAPELDLFDAQFFSVHYRLGNYMDPMSRKMLEQTYQAIYDAGVSPAQLSGKNVGVYVGSSFSDSEKHGFFDCVSKSGLGILGSSKTMFANRISYWLNTKGPSLAIDEADCSSTNALEQAYLALRRGECEAAIVGGAYLCLHPQSAIHHGRLSCTVCKENKTKSFAQDSDGFILSDAIGVLFLQKTKDALRVYAQLLHIKNEFINSVVHDDTGPKFGNCRNAKDLAAFIKQFYKEAGVTPQAVEYVEAYGTGIPDVDKCELEAIDEAYCEDREEPLLVGSVTSNIGVSEAASGVTAITKVLLGYYTGKLAANLHCSNPRQDVAALRERRIRILTEHQGFRRTYVAVNGMSTTGINSHVLLHGHFKPKDLSRYKSTIPHLVTISGRQESCISKIFNNLKSRPVDAEELALLQNIHSNNISGHLGRGFMILDIDENQQTVSLDEKCEYFDDVRRPLWFVYSGMGSQWTAMGAKLLRIPIFAAAIERCHNVLKPKGLDIVHIITSEDKTIFDNILHSFVGIAAIQIGLTDILRELGLKPDGIIGHSVGELGCAYADGCLSAEETILCAYSRGLVSLQTPLIRGSMAAVGLKYEHISPMCPPEIDVACHNSCNSSTISGPADVMREFVSQLTAKGVFAKEVPCSNIAYHSRYIADAAPHLLKYLKEVIKHPKPRSKNWLSTSVPQEKWGEELGKYCSAEYHTNNLLSPVLFEETSRLIPNNAVLVEVAPHGLLQAILKRAVSADCRHVPLTRRGHSDNALFLLQAIGNLYMHGYTPKVQALYPKVQFPVSTGTPMLSHLVEWIHNEKWLVSSFVSGEQRKAAACNFLKSIHDDDSSYLRGHVIREKNCYPFAAALVAAWDTLSMHTGLPKRQSSVQFRSVQLYSQPILHDQHALSLSVSLHRGTGWFEIMNEQSRVASGYIILASDTSHHFKGAVRTKTTDFMLSSQAIYQLLHDRDYQYSDEFITIEAASTSLSEAVLVWNGNWVTFIEGLLQLNALRQSHTGISMPTHIRSLCINVKEHHMKGHAYQLNGKTVMTANVDDIQDLTRCGGVLLQNIKYRNLPPGSQGIKTLDLVIPRTLADNSNRTKAKNVAQKRHVNSAVTVQCSQIGDLETLHCVEVPHLEQTGNIITVHYAGLGISDVKRAIGATLSCNANKYGMDYSGTTKSGERVMGLVQCGAASSVVRAQPELLWPVPAHWSLEDAATVPLAYAHALYCLKIKTDIQPDMNVLVHGGAGALGQAAIAVALAHQCQVFTTVGDLRKKKFLQKLYPQLKDEHIGNSRDCTFADNVLLATKGEGCDIIISCVKGDLKDVSFRCSSLLGVFIDTFQIQNSENYQFKMSHIENERSYILSDFSSVFKNQRFEEMKYLQTMMSKGISAGYIRPLSRVTYAPADVKRAFRLLAGSRHCGRVLLRMQESVSNISPRILCSPNECQLMVWDNGALGIQLADRFVDRGAKKLYICSTNSTSYQEFKLESWRKLGVQVVLCSKDFNSNTDATSIIKDASQLGTIQGIYVVITKEANCKNKADLTSALNTLDSESRLLCPQLKYFLVASTVSDVGQETCLARADNGYTATCLDLSQLDKACCRDALDATERALCSAFPVLLARTERAQAPTLLEQLTVLAEIKIPQDGNFNKSLQDLGMAEEKLPIIRAFLNGTHNKSFNEQILPQLTLNSIQELEVSKNIAPENVTGLHTFFSHVASDVLLATAELVMLPTLCKDNTLTENEFDVNLRYMYIIPGMEGQYERFRVLCERLKMPALVLQPGLDRPHETVRETAERYVMILKRKTNIENNFYLLGYETGVLVALEVAAILEDEGLTGTVFLVGCSPDEVRLILQNQLSYFETEEQLQEAIVRHVYTLITGEDTTKLDNVLRDASNWSQRVDACVRTILSHMSHTSQYICAFLEAALLQIQRTRNYVPRTRALRSQLVLLHSAPTCPTSELPALQQHSQRPVAIHQLRSPLSFVLNDMECSAIINQYLDANIKRSFEEMNLCVTYDTHKEL